MKKRTTMLALLLATGAGTCLQAQEKLTQFKVRDAITVRTPIMNDSINPKGEKHTAKDLLKTPYSRNPIIPQSRERQQYLLIGDRLACRTLHDGEIKNHFTGPLGNLYQRRIKDVERKC